MSNWGDPRQGLTSDLLSVYDAQTAILDWLGSLGHFVDYSDENEAIWTI